MHKKTERSTLKKLKPFVVWLIVIIQTLNTVSYLMYSDLSNEPVNWWTVWLTVIGINALFVYVLAGTALLERWFKDEHNG